MKKLQKYNTNLASEYYVLSMLYRLGVDAYLTLGNKKSIDIVIEHGKNVQTVDVKGLAGTTMWPLDNFKGGNKNHYIVLVSFINKISEPSIVPEVYIVPSKEIRKFFYENPKRTRLGINLYKMRKSGTKYKGAWHYFTNCRK